MAPKWLPKNVVGSHLFAYFWLRFPNIDFWMHFGRHSAPFWLSLAPFGSVLAPFWSLWFAFRLCFTPLGRVISHLSANFSHWLIFGRSLAHFWLPLVFLWVLLAPFWHPSAALAHFCLLLVPFGCLLAPFCPLLAPFASTCEPFGSISQHLLPRLSAPPKGGISRQG